MDFLLVYPGASEIGRYPFFGTTVAAAAAEAAAALQADELVVVDGATGDSPALERPGVRGAILAPGVVAPPVDAIRALVAAADEPLHLKNTTGQTLALAGTADALAPAVRPSFGETANALRAAESPAGAVPGHTRITDAATWSAAIRESQRRTAGRFIENGALVEDPETLWADPTCEVGPGARIGASVRLTGDTKIAPGAEVQSFCRLENTEVEAGARILSHCVLLDSSIGRDAKVGPFAHIRPNTRLEPESFAAASSRPRTPCWRGGRRCPTCPTWGTRTSASAPTWGPGPSPATTTGAASTEPWWKPARSWAATPFWWRR